MRLNAPVVLGAAVLALASANLRAQTAPPPPAQATDRVVYEAGFYAAFSPRTALDMIEQTPGFVFNTGDDTTRGFSGAVGNVLIDGERLGAKSQNLRDVLGRVAATEVLRIEILRGSDVAGDASGAAVLANVVRTRTSGGGTWEAGVEVTNEHVPAPNGKFGWSGRKESFEYSLGGTAYTHDHNSRGSHEVTDGAGTLIELQHVEIPHQHGEYALNGQLALPAGQGRLTMTGQAQYFAHEEQTTRLTTSPAGAQLEDEHFPFDEERRTGEAGVTYQRGIADWDLNLTGLATRRRVQWDATSTHFDADSVQDSEFIQNVHQESGETIARGTLTRILTNGRLEFGAEVALNTLDGQMSLTQDLGGGPVPVDVPNANLSVEETRGEAFVSDVWRMSDLWSLDSRLAVETSRLSFTGDTEQSVSLTYVKPRVQLTRAFGKHQLQMRVFREVGQLDFTDFVSTAALADDNINGGNPDLRPQTEWTAELEADLRFPGDSALRVRAFKNFLDDVVDFVPMGPPGAQFDAPGNIGKGTIIGAEVSLRVPLRPVLPGGTLTVAGRWSDTEVTDPVTGEQRQLGGYNENTIRVELRQDLNAAKLAWGMNYEAFSSAKDYRLDEINTFRELHRLDVFIETTWIASLKIRLEAQSALNDTEKRDRRFYSPDRTGALVRHESGFFQPGHWWLFTVSSRF